MCGEPFSALPLFVAGVFADDLNTPVTTDHLALFTDLLDGGSNLHGVVARSGRGPVSDKR
jgi:hypothetical protein